MTVFDEVYLGNTLLNWLIAVCILLIVFTVLKIIQRVAITKISRLASSTVNQLDDLIVDMLKNTKFFILLIASAYASSHVVELKPSVEEVWQKIVILVLIVQGGLWAGTAISFALGRTIQKRMDQDSSSTTTITFLGFVARVLLWTIVLLLILGNLGVNITGLVAGLGIGGIAVALALQNILGDLFASLSIVLDKPFVIGDFVVVDSLSGTIEHIGLKTTRIRSLSGEQIIFSNNDLLKSRIRNYKRMAERRAVFSFGVVYQTPLATLKRIKELVTEIIENEPDARFDRVHFKEYAASSLNYEAVYFVTVPDIKTWMDIQEDINLKIFEQFHEEGIEFAYPTQTLYIQRETT
jgi:small-conductance mechanosensitive channel